MHKKKVFLLVLLVLLPSVYALNLDDFPLLLVAPLALIVLFILIFAIIIIKDKMAMRKLSLPTFENIGKAKKPTKNKKEESKETKKEEPLKEAPPKDLPISKGEVKKEIDHYSKIKELEQKLDSLDVNTAHQELVNIIRRFFSDHFNLGYEFTYEELEKELEEKNEKILLSSAELSKIGYGPHPLSKEELSKMIKEFKTLIKKLTSKTESNNIDEDIKEIKNLIKQGKKASRKDKNSAIDLYEKVYVLYHKLPKEEKQKVYSFVVGLYQAIK